MFWLEGASKKDAKRRWGARVLWIKKSFSQLKRVGMKICIEIVFLAVTSRQGKNPDKSANGQNIVIFTMYKKHSRIRIIL